MIQLFNALQLVVKRTQAHWKLLSSIVVGVVVAVAILASTPLYSNALNDLGLRHTLDKQPAPMLDIDVYSSNNPIDRDEFTSTTAFIKQQVDAYIGNFIRQEESFILSQDFNAMIAGEIIPTDSSRPRNPTATRATPSAPATATSRRRGWRSTTRTRSSRRC